jgi:hypothetical protein
MKANDLLLQIGLMNRGYCAVSTHLGVLVMHSMISSPVPNTSYDKVKSRVRSKY